MISIHLVVTVSTTGSLSPLLFFATMLTMQDVPAETIEIKIDEYTNTNINTNTMLTMQEVPAETVKIKIDTNTNIDIQIKIFIYKYKYKHNADNVGGPS